MLDLVIEEIVVGTPFEHKSRRSRFKSQPKGDYSEGIIDTWARFH